MAVTSLKRAKYDYKKLMTTIRDQHTFGIDVYPSTLHDVYELMENHSSTDKNNREEEARKEREREKGYQEREEVGETKVVGTVEGEEEDHKLASNFYKLQNL